MHIRKADLLDRHRRELLALDQELAVLAGLPQDLPMLDQVHVQVRRLFGSHGRLTFDCPAMADARDIAMILAPADPLVTFKNGILVGYMPAASGAGPQGMPINRKDIGPVVFVLDTRDESRGSIRWLYKGWWVVLEWPTVPHSILGKAGKRLLRRVSSGRVTKQEWVDGLLKPVEILKFSHPMPDCPGEWVACYPMGTRPIDLLDY